MAVVAQEEAQEVRERQAQQILVAAVVQQQLDLLVDQVDQALLLLLMKLQSEHH